MTVTENSIILDAFKELITAAEICDKNQDCEACVFYDACNANNRYWKILDMESFMPLDLRLRVIHMLDS